MSSIKIGYVEMDENTPRLFEIARDIKSLAGSAYTLILSINVLIDEYESICGDIDAITHQVEREELEQVANTLSDLKGNIGSCLGDNKGDPYAKRRHKTIL